MRVDRKKFTCINDDMNKTADPDPRILLELRAFYEDAFPFKSQVRPLGRVIDLRRVLRLTLSIHSRNAPVYQFELSPDEFNPYIRYDELMDYKARMFFRRRIAHALGVILAFLALAVLSTARGRAGTWRFLKGYLPSSNSRGGGTLSIV